MRMLLLLFIVLALAQNSYCQQNLSGSAQTSIYTYIYKLLPEEALKLFKGNMQQVNEKYLHTKLDSFLTLKSPPNNLQPGNYLIVKAENNHIQYELKTIGNLQFSLLNNYSDLVILLHSMEGAIISKAVVFIGQKRIPFDSVTKTFRVNKRIGSGLIKVYQDDVLYLFPITKKKSNYYHKPGFGNKLIYSTPIKYISIPIAKLFRNKQKRYNYSGITDYEYKHSGFIVCNKPKYKPGDTVKCKAVVMKRNGKPVNEKLLLRLSDSQLDKDTILAVLSPYRPGAYTYQFVLSDSLDIDLDEKYTLSLETLCSRKYDYGNYDGDLDEREFALKRQVLVRGNFEYEDYELGSINFTARADKEENHRGNPVAVYLKARDENDLAVLDGRVQIYVLPKQAVNGKFFNDKLFIPDTLWNYSTTLDAIGETKIVIPDSIFPKASFEYIISCNFLNSNNELETKELDLSFDNDQYKVVFNTLKDSLKIELQYQQQSLNTIANLHAYNVNDELILDQAITVPITIPINPFIQHYQVLTDSAKGDFSIYNNGRLVNCLGFRTKDSVRIEVVNTSRLWFWYSLFAGKRLIGKGYTNDFTYIHKSLTAKNYFISLQYIYGNKIHNEEFTIPFQNKLLNIEVREPDYIYPGQTTDIGIKVTNAAGKPVESVDITAYSFTAKFEKPSIPNVPYLGKYYPNRRRGASFLQANESPRVGNKKLDWERWSREMRLDSVEYFKFTHPDNIYINKEWAPDSLTQLAAFVVQQGDLLPIQQIYIDEVPYYFNQAEQVQHYSFPVNPGKHALRLRTYNRLITVDSIWVFKGQKTFISINADTAINKLIKLKKMPDSLTIYEKALWSKYMIVLENNFGESMATVSTANNLYLLNKPTKNYSVPSVNFLIGPLPNQTGTLSVKNKFTQLFDVEGNYLYNISQGLIKQKQIPFGRYPFRSNLSNQIPSYDFRDYILTERQVDSLWQEYLNTRNANEDLFNNIELNKFGNGQLKIEIPKDDAGNEIFVKNIFLFRKDDADFVRVYKGRSRNLGYLQPGNYRIVLLMKGDNYFIEENVLIKMNGINFYRLNPVKFILRDSVSINIASIINSREKKRRSYFEEEDLGQIKESFNEKYLDPAIFPFIISGSVRDAKQGEPLMGVSVNIKGTKNATVTDGNGNFKIRVPSRGTLVFSSIGYTHLEKRIDASGNYDIKLQPAINALNEVVVTGYSASVKRSLTSSVSIVQMNNMVAGKLAGVSIRGASSFSSNAQPLIIIDGIPFSGDLSKLDSSKVASVNILKEAEATAIYGAQAANGVILITTRNGERDAKLRSKSAEESNANSLRHNFHDDAFWQPALTTNAAGEARFQVKFPDDITNWRTFFIAIGRHRQTGFYQKSIRSFKAYSANLSVPAFAVLGDSINIIGKVLSYSLDTIQLQRSFSVNGKELLLDRLRFTNAHIDSMPLNVLGTDSLKMTYSIRKVDGYFDGEERLIPVYRQGVLEARGMFAVLENDTSISVNLGSNQTPITVYASSSALPVLLEEIESIKRYEYLCNEQIASKIKALLLKKRAYSYLKKEFKEDQHIRELLSLLNQGKTASDLWGWWKNNEPQLWISLHAIEALLMAETEGFTIILNKRLITDYLINQLESFTSPDKIYSIKLLLLLNARADYKKYLDMAEKDPTKLGLNDRLQIISIKQQLGMPVDLSIYLNRYNSTAMGNIYWGEENYLLSDNAFQNTILMYKILKKEGGYNMQLKKISNYFLEMHKDGHWRNIYESSMILETILPDILLADTIASPSSIIINDSIVVKDFPFTYTFNNSPGFVVRKRGVRPVYFTAYSKSWNAHPEKLTGNFGVSTVFKRNDIKLDLLKAGEPVIMEITVMVKADANYVMVEVPIPAGCSYEDKEQSYANNEVHREYFKNKVNIFCSSLKKGFYKFYINLLPRYTGSFHLNPANVSMMYFPVFNGREGMEKIRIK